MTTTEDKIVQQALVFVLQEIYPESFTFLGFTHLCSRRLSDCGFTVKRFTIAKRQRAKLKELRKWLYDNRAIPVADQGRYPNTVIRGVINYFG